MGDSSFFAIFEGTLMNKFHVKKVDFQMAALHARIELQAE